jgi:Tfp pilus assembly protein PilO
VKARLESLPSRTLLIIAGAVVVLYAAAVWMLLVSPKRSDAATAQADLAAAEVRLAEAQVAASRPPRGAATPVADVFRLARAMPSSADQPGLVLEITRLARRSGVTLGSITPGEQVAAAGGPALIPVTVTVTGSYGKIANFLARTRGLVTVRDGRIHAEGRLLSVQSVTLSESATDGFPKLDASIAIDAFVYDGPILPPDIPEPVEEVPSDGGTDAAGSTD